MEIVFGVDPFHLEEFFAEFSIVFFLDCEYFLQLLHLLIQILLIMLLFLYFELGKRALFFS